MMNKDLPRYTCTKLVFNINKYAQIFTFYRRYGWTVGHMILKYSIYIIFFFVSYVLFVILFIFVKFCTFLVDFILIVH